MKKILLVITSILFVCFFIFITSKNFPSLYKDIKITDYIGSIFTISSFMVALFAYRYAKDYIGQERYKNASTFAIDILHKDMVLLSSLDNEDLLLYMLSQRMTFYIHSSDKHNDDFCIKHIAGIYKKLNPIVELMRGNITLVENDIFKARIVGCTIRSERKEISLILRDYEMLASKLNQLTVLIAAFLVPYYGFNYNNIDPGNEIGIELIHDSHERTEKLKEVSDLYTQANDLIKSIKKQFLTLRDGSHDLNLVFQFK